MSRRTWVAFAVLAVGLFCAAVFVTEHQSARFAFILVYVLIMGDVLVRGNGMSADRTVTPSRVSVALVACLPLLVVGVSALWLAELSCFAAVAAVAGQLGRSRGRTTS